MTRGAVYEFGPFQLAAEGPRLLRSGEPVALSDVVRVEIDGIGSLENRFVEEGR